MGESRTDKYHTGGRLLRLLQRFTGADFGFFSALCLC